MFTFFVKAKVQSTTIPVLSAERSLELQFLQPGHDAWSLIVEDGQIARPAHEFLASLLKGRGLSIAESTVDQYGRVLAYLYRWLQLEFGGSHSLDTAIEILERPDILSWIHFMRDQGLSNSVLRTRESVAKLFLDWLSTIEGGKRRNQDDSPWNPEAGVRNLVRGSSPNSPKYIVPEVVIPLLCGLHNECERCMFHTQFDTGLRISELVDLRISELPNERFFSPDVAFFPLELKGVKGHAGNSKQRITLISRAVLKRIRAYHNTMTYRRAAAWPPGDDDKPVFLTCNGLRWGTRNATKQFKCAVARSGVTCKFTTHWMRHGTATSVLRSDAGKDALDRLLITKMMLGHSRIETTETYRQLEPQIMLELTQRTSRIDRLEEAEQIREATYLPPLKHVVRRGHHVS